jgi:predicted site-specific integrase-resolvase
MEPDGWMLLQEAAEAYKIKPRTLTRWCATGKVEAVKVRQAFWAVNPRSLDVYLEPVPVEVGK